MRVFRFGEFEADEGRFELRHRARIVRVQRIVLETIFFFLQSDGEVVTKRDLARGPWKGLKVSDGAVSRAIMLARRAILDQSGSMILTVHGRGYRFAPKVEIISASGSPPPFRPASELESARRLKAHAAGIDDMPSSPSAGRPAELELLQAEFERAQSGRGRIVVVSGDAGIGKTTLVEHFAQQLERRGVLVAWGRSWQATSAPELWPWLEIGRYCLSRLEESDKSGRSTEFFSSIVSLASNLSRALDVFIAHELEAKNGYLPVFDLVARFLGELARSWPLAVLLEDLHEADDPSLLLLEFLRQRIGGTSLLVVATRRPLERSDEDRSPFKEAGRHVRTLHFPVVPDAARSGN
jgi:DNA-binding winged helix-turn-helix (wHTH) protein